MSYLQDKREKKKKLLNILFVVVILFIVFYFSTFIWRGLSSVAHFVFAPVLGLGNFAGEKLSDVSAIFKSKASLLRENEELRGIIAEKDATLSNYNSIFEENIAMKEILSRKPENKTMILAGILSKPNRSPYDTLTIDAGVNLGVSVGDSVFAYGITPIGRVVEVFEDSAKIILYSSPGEKTEVTLGRGIFTEAVGRGGGNFSINILEGLELKEGMEVTLPGTPAYVLGIVETVVSDPREIYTKALLQSPVNIGELEFVEIEP